MNSSLLLISIAQVKAFFFEKILLIFLKVSFDWLFLLSCDYKKLLLIKSSVDKNNLVKIFVSHDLRIYDKQFYLKQTFSTRFAVVILNS